MRISVILTTLFLCSCFDLYQEDDPYFSPRDEPEEYRAPSTVRARIITDARLKGLSRQVEGGCPRCDDLLPSPNGMICRQHEKPLSVVSFPVRVEDGPGALRERAFFCEEASVYWYRWRKLDPPEERWLGPFRIRVR